MFFAKSIKTREIMYKDSSKKRINHYNKFASFRA